MTNDDREDYRQGMSFGSFGGGSFDYTGPYIPEAIDCQRCGYCVRGCPTYKVRPEESYSPRGRVRLIERLIKNKDVLSNEDFAALTSCTLCRACETTCPSKMDYSGLYRLAMESATVKPKRGLALKLMLAIFAERRPAHRTLNVLIRLYQKSGLSRLLQSLPDGPHVNGFKQLSALVPVPYETQTIPDQTQTMAPHRRGEVALFTGCVASVLDTQTHAATIALLSRLGYDVRPLPNQTCCGAMHAHDGDVERAKAFARINVEAVSKSGARAIVYNSSGCGAFLGEYDTLLKDGAGDGAPEPLPPVVDILSFLMEDDRIQELSFRELNIKVAVHEPCSQRHVLKSQEVIYKALAQIPKLDVMPLAGNAMCCGAGGTKMVTHPELASPLREQKIEALLDSGADLLMSTNLTCALHLARGVREAGREAGSEIAVLHPVSLLARQVI